MGFFEDELKKMFGAKSLINDARFVGRTCVGRLGESVNVKLQFLTLGTYERYEAVKATLFNRNDGEIDSNTFRFADIFGKNVRTNNLNRNLPYIWAKTNNEYEWYSYKPTSTDYAAVANEVNNYMELFLESQRSLAKEKANNLYLLYSCNEWCEKSKAPLILVTTDKKTLCAAIGGEILIGNMNYLGEAGGKGFAAYKKDYLAGNDVLKELEYGFVKEMDEALLSEPDTMPGYYMVASDLLAADFNFDPDEFEFEYNNDEMEQDDEEYDDEI